MKDKIDELWSYLKIFAFRNPETILEQIGVVLCILTNETKVNLNVEYDEFEILFTKEAMNIFEKNDNFLIRTEIFFKIPSPKVLKMILSYLTSILKKHDAIEVYSILLDYCKKEKKIEKNRELTFYEFQFILKDSFDERDRYKKFQKSIRPIVLFCYTSLGEQLNRIKSYERISKYDEFEKTREESNILRIKNKLENKGNGVYHNKNLIMFEPYDLILMDMNNENNFSYFHHEENLEILQIMKNRTYDHGKLVLVFPFNRKQLENIHKEILNFCEKILIFSREINMDSKVIFILNKQKNNDKIKTIRYIRSKKIETDYIYQERAIDKIFESNDFIYFTDELLYELAYEKEKIIDLLKSNTISKYNLKEIIEKEEQLLNKIKLLYKNVKEYN